jgi:hypothetical protein
MLATGRPRPIAKNGRTAAILGPVLQHYGDTVFIACRSLSERLKLPQADAKSAQTGSINFDPQALEFQSIALTGPRGTVHDPNRWAAPAPWEMHKGARGVDVRESGRRLEFSDTDEIGGPPGHEPRRGPANLPTSVGYSKWALLVALLVFSVVLSGAAAIVSESGW